MKLNQERMARYLAQQKKLNDYLMKLNSRNRDAMVKLQAIRYRLFQGEELLRELLNYVVEENIDG